jgi:hypothetical protein
MKTQNVKVLTQVRIMEKELDRVMKTEELLEISMSKVNSEISNRSMELDTFRSIRAS